MQCLLPSTSCKVSPCKRHMGSPHPHSTHPQSSSFHGTVKAGSLSEIEKRALPPPCFPSFNFQSSRSHGATLALLHRCLRRPDCTSSQVRCIPSQPDQLMTQSIATLLLSQGEPTVWSSKVFANPTELWPFSPASLVHWQSLLPLKDAS